MITWHQPTPEVWPLAAQLAQTARSRQTGGSAPESGGRCCVGRRESPGYTEEQRADVERLRTQCRELSITVATHPHRAQGETGEARTHAHPGRPPGIGDGRGWSQRARGRVKVIVSAVNFVTREGERARSGGCGAVRGALPVSV